MIRPFGIDMKVMLGAEHTGGTFSAIVGEVKPGEGPPPHLHRDREEYFFVLEGTYSLGVNGNESTIGPGTLVFVPRGTVHTFKNVSATMGSSSNGPSPARTATISGPCTRWSPPAGSTPRSSPRSTSGT